MDTRRTTPTKGRHRTPSFPCRDCERTRTDPSGNTPPASRLSRTPIRGRLRLPRGSRGDGVTDAPQRELNRGRASAVRLAHAGRQLCCAAGLASAQRVSRVWGAAGLTTPQDERGTEKGLSGRRSEGATAGTDRRMAYDRDDCERATLASRRRWQRNREFCGWIVIVAVVVVIG